MTQHITQEKAVALARKVAASNGDTLKDVPEKETIELLHGLANAAIQHYLDQHKAELPVLPDTYGSVEEQIVERYRVGKTQGGFWPSCVKAGDGNMDVFVGSTKQAENVRQALQTACLDGAFIASQKAKEQYKDYGQQCAAQARKLALEAVLDDSKYANELTVTGGVYEGLQCKEAITAGRAALAGAEPKEDHLIFNKGDMDKYLNAKGIKFVNASHIAIRYAKSKETL